MMSRDMEKLRKRAEDGKLTKADQAYLAQREGIRRFDTIRALADEPVFDDPDEEEPEDGYDTMTVAQLEDELESRDLPKTGNKDELIARLREDDESEEE